LDEQSLLLSLDQPFYRDKHLFVHLHHQVAMLDGKTITLTRLQYQVLVLLVQHAEEVVPRAAFLRQIWGHMPELSTKRVNVHIKALRRKLGAYADRYIETAYGVGYRFWPTPGL
jgi:two-component system phosphate regulon response regulator PhoB